MRGVNPGHKSHFFISGSHSTALLIIRIFEASEIGRSWSLGDKKVKFTTQTSLQEKVFSPPIPREALYQG